MKSPAKTVLVLRLSSMGDLLLSTAFLESIPPGVGVDWVVSDKFSFVLEGHPRIRKLYSYNKSTGLSGWIKLMLEISREPHDARVDLHVTLRSLIARVIFLFSGQRMVPINKQRIRTTLYFLLKRFTPRFLRPTPYWVRFSEMGQRVVRKLGVPFPVALHPPRFSFDVEETEAKATLAEYQLEAKKYIAVMPASRWVSKEWGSERYFQSIQMLRQKRPELSSWPVLVLGRESDRACGELLDLLNAASIPARSALGEMEFRMTAYLLQQAKVYLGGDTGLAHLAEAVGTPAVIVFGPTQPDVGFGPWRQESHSVQATVVCSPCSKDGRPCYRLGQPYECFKRIQPESVANELGQRL